MIDVVSIFFHLDQYLGSLIVDYGIWVYAILFAIIFLETGLVITPFLPGDSLIFVAGTLAAAGLLDVSVLFISLSVAAILGDTANYWMGHKVGRSVLEKRKIKFVKKEHLDKAYAFYEKHGRKTIVMARFLPFVRTFAPFVAGVVRMGYGSFAAYNIAGGILWVASFLTLGYFLGGVEIVKSNLAAVIIFIVLLTFVPPLISFIRHRTGSNIKKEKQN